MKTKLGIILGTLFVVLGLGIPSAMANVVKHDPLCDSPYTNSHCLNDWNGVYGGQIKMYLYGASNETFQEFDLYNMCNHGHVTSTCPFNNHTIDNQLINETIMAVFDPTQGECVSSNTSNGYAYLGACPDRSGVGGANGVVMVQGAGSGCSGGAAYYLVDRYWSNYYGIQVGLKGAGSNGGLVNFASPFTCWHALT